MDSIKKCQLKFMPPVCTKKISFIESQPNPQKKNLYPTQPTKKAVISRPNLTQPMDGRNPSPTPGGDGVAALLTVSG